MNDNDKQEAALVKQRTSDEKLSERFALLGKLFGSLAANPRLISTLRNALKKGDAKGFQAVLQEIGWGTPLPPGECIDIVETISTVIFTSEWREVCRWRDGKLSARTIRKAGGAIADAKTSRRMLEILKAVGVIVCTWEKVQVPRVVTYTKTKTICPGSPPGPGPDPSKQAKSGRGKATG